MAGPCSPCTRGRCTRWSPRWCRRGGWPPRPPGRSPPSPQHCDQSRSRLSGLERIKTLPEAMFYILCLVCCHLAIWGWGWEDWWWTEWTPLETSLSTLHFIKMPSRLNISSKKVDSIYEFFCPNDNASQKFNFFISINALKRLSFFVQQLIIKVDHIQRLLLLSIPGT